MKRYLIATAAVAVLGFTAAQFGSAADPRNRVPKAAKTLEALEHPPEAVTKILQTSCYDCHSSVTKWPWYSHLPFIGPQLELHVNEGRVKLDFTDWQSHIDSSERDDRLEDLCIKTKARVMPLPQYLILHPLARLSDDDVVTLCQWSETQRKK